MEEEKKRFMEWSSEELKEPCSQTEFCTSDISYDLQTGIPDAGGEDGNVNDNDNDDNDKDNDDDVLKCFMTCKLSYLMQSELINYTFRIIGLFVQLHFSITSSFNYIFQLLLRSTKFFNYIIVQLNFSITFRSTTFFSINHKQF